MFNIADLPAVRAQLERDAAAAKQEPAPGRAAAVVDYARAPDAGGAAPTAGRPPAVQGSTR